MDLRRRDVCFGLGLGAGAALAMLCGQRRGTANALDASQPPPGALRPPGAGTESDFLAACIRCSLCVDACTYDTLLAASPGDLRAGAPFFDARANPCWLCQDHDELLCIAACPTGALAPTELEQIDIGVAEIDHERCLAYNGVTCRACWHACPFPDVALRYDKLLRPVVDAEACIGCGLCEHACLTDGTSIVVKPKCEQA